MSIVRNRPSNARDPLTMARDLLAWDPFFQGRQASAFTPPFEVKETPEAFVLRADVPGVAEGLSLIHISEPTRPY